MPHLPAKRLPAKLLAAAVLVQPLIAFAGFTPCTNIGLCALPNATQGAEGGKRSDTKAYVGLNWNFQAQGPELVVGARHVRTGADRKSEGAKVQLSVPFLGGLRLGQIKAAYVEGPRSALREWEVGYSFEKAAPLAGLGFQVPYVNLGVDYVWRTGFSPFVTLNSLERPRAGRRGLASSLSCTSGTLGTVAEAQDFWGTPYFVPDEVLVDGRTCYEEND